MESPERAVLLDTHIHMGNANSGQDSDVSLPSVRSRINTAERSNDIITQHMGRV